MNNKIYISKISSILLLVYIFVTLFIGGNVRHFLHIEWKADGILPLTHYVAFPFLLISFFFSINKVSYKRNEKIFFLLAIIIVFIQRVIFNKTAGLSFLINNIFEPIILMSLLRLTRYKYIFRIRNIIIAFLLINSSIAVFEFITQSFIFADPAALSSYAFLSGNEDMRAAGIQGHPLQNSFLVSIIMTCIMFSNIKALYKYGLFFVGWISLTCFNTRSSILLMGVVFVIGLLHDMKRNRVSLLKRFFSIIAVVVIGAIAFNFALSHGMGGRLSIGMNSDDGSSLARIVLLQAFSQISLTDLLFGAATGTSESIMTQYSLVAIENSFANIILGYGLIFTIIFSFLWAKILWANSNNKFMTLMVMMVIFLLFNANNAIMTDCPILAVVVMSLYSFSFKKQRI